MKSMTLECKAKINLALDVLGERENGYHDVELIYVEIPLADIIKVTLRSDGKIN